MNAAEALQRYEELLTRAEPVRDTVLLFAADALANQVRPLLVEVESLRKERDEAKARANEAARLSAEARDAADDLRKQIGDLKEHIEIVESDRDSFSHWADNMVVLYGLPYESGETDRVLIERFVVLTVAERDRLAEQVARVRALHSADTKLGREDVCKGCDIEGAPWVDRCRTLAALYAPAVLETGAP